MSADLWELIIGLGGALLSALLGLGVYGLRIAAKKVGNDYAAGVMVRAGEAVQRAVLEVQQTFVAEAKDRNGDGKLSAAERKQAAAMAAAKAKSYLGSKGLKELGKIFGLDLDSFFSSKVEAQVAANKMVTSEKKP